MTRPTPRTTALLVLLVGTGWLIGDLLGAATAVGAAAFVLLGGSPRRLPIAAVACVGLAAASWPGGNRGRWGTVSFDLVRENPWPGRWALCAVVLLLVGVTLDLSTTEGNRDEREP